MCEGLGFSTSASKWSAYDLRRCAGDACSVGWLTSVSLHAALALGAVMMAHHLALAPQPAPFTWHVAMVAASPEPRQSSGSPRRPLHTPQHTSVSPAPLCGTHARWPAWSALRHPEPVAPKTDEHLISTPQPPASTQVPPQQLEPSAETAPVLPQAELLSSQDVGRAAQNSAGASVGSSIPRPHYGWVSEIIIRRMEELKRYPAEARLEGG
jgi:hypothetical protein